MQQLTTEAVRSRLPVFREEGLLKIIVEQGHLHRFPAGTTIMDYGDLVRMMPVILAGSIKVSRESEDGSELLLYYLTAGESCAMTFDCSLADRYSEIRAVAEEDTELLGLPLHLFAECMRFPSWQRFVLESYSRRMNELIRTVDQVAFHQLDARLCDYIRKRAGLREDQTVYATHRDIANDLNVSREAISRLLKALQKRGIIKLSRHTIELAQVA